MSDISLLMAGVLTTGQLFPPKLPEPPPVNAENAVQQSAPLQETRVVPPAQIPPPEFIQAEASPQAADWALKPEHQNILKKITQKIQSPTSPTPPLPHSPTPPLPPLPPPLQCPKSHRCRNLTMCNPLTGLLRRCSLW